MGVGSQSETQDESARDSEEIWRESYELLLAFVSFHGHPHIRETEPLGLW